MTPPFTQGRLRSGLPGNPSSVFSATSCRKSTFPSGKADYLGGRRRNTSSVKTFGFATFPSRGRLCRPAFSTFSFQLYTKKESLRHRLRDATSLCTREAALRVTCNPSSVIQARRLFENKKRALNLISALDGDPCENRTRVTAVKGPCLNRLTNGPLW